MTSRLSLRQRYRLVRNYRRLTNMFNRAVACGEDGGHETLDGGIGYCIKGCGAVCHTGGMTDEDIDAWFDQQARRPR